MVYVRCQKRDGVGELIPSQVPRAERPTQHAPHAGAEWTKSARANGCRHTAALACSCTIIFLRTACRGACAAWAEPMGNRWDAEATMRCIAWRRRWRRRSRSAQNVLGPNALPIHGADVPLTNSVPALTFCRKEANDQCMAPCAKARRCDPHNEVLHCLGNSENRAGIPIVALLTLLGSWADEAG